MKATDRSILLGLVILGLLAAFWFLLLAPKRETAAELETQVNDLQAQVEAQEQLAAAAEQAEAEYGRNYERLIVLGKAAPADGDTPSLLAQLTAQAEASKTTFGSLTTEGAEVVEVSAPAQTTTDQNQAAGASGETVPPATTPGAPTEASAAALPLGATVGPAGLGILPYELQFSGDFFEIADLLERIDGQVEGNKDGADVEGRLITVNGFTLAPLAEESGGDELAADLSITTYVLPDSQGLTAGATPSAPPATVPPATPTPTSTTPAP
jgi:cytoskeletal protein RodZ